eukprot:CAMPEP_0194318220 /NCGR_PEP_ID=MMETSP0171-20130528/14855_1 /TAXON_ID=218684 /ORGANISM="Corethron pennatum, Strain L29A3" /LENGTH=79 /DNA_ID=CAMNT_0039075061 /DNA_START=165 /DNA_END=404 /DNA_ORIENTATION=+
MFRHWLIEIPSTFEQKLIPAPSAEDYDLEPVYASRPLPIDAVCEEVAAEDVHLGPVHASRPLLIDAAGHSNILSDDLFL